MGTLIGAAIVAVILSAMIWVSVRAKPLAGKPYRWATFTGIHSAFMALTFFYLNYYRFPNLTLLSLTVSCCAGISSFGILHRRKSGVVMYAVTYLLLVLFRISSEGPSLRADLVLPISLAVVTLAYFRKRWRLFQTTAQSGPMKGITYTESEIEEFKRRA